MYISNIKIRSEYEQTRPSHNEFFSRSQRTHEVIIYSFRVLHQWLCSRKPPYRQFFRNETTSVYIEPLCWISRFYKSGGRAKGQVAAMFRLRWKETELVTLIVHSCYCSLFGRTIATQTLKAISYCLGAENKNMKTLDCITAQCLNRQKIEVICHMQQIPTLHAVKGWALLENSYHTTRSTTPGFQRCATELLRQVRPRKLNNCMLLHPHTRVYLTAIIIAVWPILLPIKIILKKSCED
jgi:hypothetical protein